MALEVEGRKNRDTHRLFSTLESTLGDSVKGMEARSVSSRYLRLSSGEDKKLHSCKRNSHKSFIFHAFFHYYELKLYVTDHILSSPDIQRSC